MISFSDFFSFRNATLRYQVVQLFSITRIHRCSLFPYFPLLPANVLLSFRTRETTFQRTFFLVLIARPHISSLSFPILHSVLISFSFLKAHSSHAQYLVRFYIYSRALKNMVLYHYNRFSKHVAKAEKGVVVVQQSTRWGSNLHMGIRNARTRYARVPK